MKRFSFSTFEVDDSNRGAFEVCRAVSELHSVTPQPVVLLGDDGCGKTHLLYAIVNHVRASSARAGLAYVTAKEFPKEVRSLAIDPSPVEKASSAILLIDQLEKFSDLTEELEAIVRVFLDNRHFVVVASAVHPERLKNLTDGLRKLLVSGLIVGIHPRMLKGASIGTSGAGGDQQAERRQLLERAERAEQEAAEARSVIAQLRSRADSEHGRSERSAAELETARQSMEALKAAIDRYRTENEDSKRRLDDLATQAAAVGPLRAGISELEAQLDEVRKERDAAERDRDLLAVKVEENADLQMRVQELTGLVEEARLQREHEDRELGAFFDRLEGIIEQTVSVRTAFRQREESVRERLAHIDDLLSRVSALGGGREEREAAEARASEAERQAAQVRQEMEDAQARFAYEVAASANEAKQTAAARDKAIEKLDQLTATCAALEVEVEGLREKVTLQAGEMEALRYEAAAQVARANAQTGEIERKYSSLCAALGHIRQTGQMVGFGLDSLRHQLNETADSISDLGKRLADAVGDDGATDIPPFSGNDSSETTDLADLAAPMRGEEAASEFEVVAGDQEPVQGDEHVDGDIAETEHAFVENLNQTVK